MEAYDSGADRLGGRLMRDTVPNRHHLGLDECVAGYGVTVTVTSCFFVIALSVALAMSR